LNRQGLSEYISLLKEGDDVFNAKVKFDDMFRGTVQESFHSILSHFQGFDNTPQQLEELIDLIIGTLAIKDIHRVILRVNI
jgi:hypothetical protein